MRIKLVTPPPVFDPSVTHVQTTAGIPPASIVGSPASGSVVSNPASETTDAFVASSANATNLPRNAVVPAAVRLEASPSAVAGVPAGATIPVTAPRATVDPLPERPNTEALLSGVREYRDLNKDTLPEDQILLGRDKFKDLLDRDARHVLNENGLRFDSSEQAHFIQTVFALIDVYFGQTVTPYLKQHPDTPEERIFSGMVHFAKMFAAQVQKDESDAGRQMSIAADYVDDLATRLYGVFVSTQSILNKIPTLDQVRAALQENDSMNDALKHVIFWDVAGYLRNDAYAQLVLGDYNIRSSEEFQKIALGGVALITEYLAAFRSGEWGLVKAALIQRASQMKNEQTSAYAIEGLAYTYVGSLVARLSGELPV